MKDDTIWDYSAVPKQEWKWYFNEDHWMDLVVDHTGMQYVGTDWTCQSGGGYFGGFQTFDEFLNNGPIQKMPKKLASEVREYILSHRKSGGSSLNLEYVLEVSGWEISGVYILQR